MAILSPHTSYDIGTLPGCALKKVNNGLGVPGGMKVAGTEEYDGVCTAHRSYQVMSLELKSTNRVDTVHRSYQVMEMVPDMQDPPSLPYYAEKTLSLPLPYLSFMILSFYSSTCIHHLSYS